jgi:peptide/nickel transport system substrate-binding protein
MSGASYDRGPFAVARRLDRRRLMRAGASLAAGSAALGGRRPVAASRQSDGSGVLTLGFNREFVSLDTKTYNFDAQQTVLNAVRQGLTGLDANLDVVPLVAESFEPESATAWRVTLRDGITFSDGTPVAIADVEAAIAAYRDNPNVGFAGQFPEWPTVEAIDERAFLLRTEQPVVLLPRLMSLVYIIPAALNRPVDVDDAPGTGPYRVVSFDKGAQTIELEPNPNYWGDPPRVASVRTRYFAEDSVRIAALQAGEIDVADSVPPDIAAALEGDANLAIARTPGTRLAHLGYNFRKPAGHPLTDPRVREALSLAVDGNAILETILAGAASPLTGLIPGTLQGAVAVGEYRHDPERARALLDEAGHDDLQLVAIWERGEFQRDTQIMETVAAMLSAVGVQLTLTEFESGGDIGAWRRGETGDWDIIGNGYGNLVGSALPTLLGVLGATPEMEEERASYHGYVVPEVADMLRRAASEVDEPTRLRLLAEAQELAWPTWPQLWGFAQNNATAYARRVDDLTLSPLNRFDLASVSVE